MNNYPKGNDASNSKLFSHNPLAITPKTSLTQQLDLSKQSKIK